MKNNKRSKLIATIGPASEKKETMKKLFEEGMTTIRLNFSHGDHEEQGARIETAKELRKELKMPISIMLDTKGPEIRIGQFEDDKIQVDKNEEVVIYSDSESYKTKKCKKGEMTVSYDMSKDLSEGKLVLVDDGKLELKITSIEPGVIKLTSKNSHVVKSNKRVNLPGTKFSMPFLAEKDITDIRYGAKQGVDFIAASFVNTPEDIQQIRGILKEENAEHIQIFAKIESQYAVDNFDAIVKSTDGVMVARGDLGLEIPYYEVPVAEKMMIRNMRQAGKPVIVATQMLDSMENNPHPTRAEVTDVYLATELGADATMLSGETAAGNYPIESVKVMSTINKRAEKEFYNKTYYEKYIQTLPETNNERSRKAKEITIRAKDGEFDYVVVRSRTGKLLTEIAKYRPNTNILGVVEQEKNVTQFGITFSVFVFPEISAFLNIKEDHNNAKKVVERYGGKPGDKYLVVDNSGITEHSL